MDVSNHGSSDASSSSSMVIKSVVRGHHVFKEVWRPRGGDKFCLQMEKFNPYDRYAVAIVMDEETVGHVPIETFLPLFKRQWHY